MKFLRWLALSFAMLLSACQSTTSPSITIIDGGQVQVVASDSRVPLVLLTQNGITPQQADRVLVNGVSFPMDQPLPSVDSIQLQLRRAVELTLTTPLGTQTLQTSAPTVGQALTEAGYVLGAADLIDPPAETPIITSLNVTFTPARDLTVQIGADVVNIRSAARTVGGALAEAGIPLIGLDTSFPLEGEALPVDGQIRVVRVQEIISVALEPIPFETQKVSSIDVPLGQEELIQSGVNGITMTRTRIRYEDGQEVSRQLEEEIVAREPQPRIVKSGEQIVMSPLPGVSGEYWTAVEMYATVYSPCESGTGSCSYGTASGARAGYGIVAVDYSIYSYLAGMRVYIPGYGTATIGDTGGGPIIETLLGVPRTKW
ncbi:MAG: G5 domain-containing protein, partial [Anaerolineales bacterium]|nr:G5 domain-containing protein [Anaerolineales bacterium]